MNYFLTRSFFFIKYGVFVAISVVNTGCNEYTDVYLKARKDLFYASEVVSFSDLQNGTQINLMTADYGCMHESGEDVQTSTHAYNRYYPQLCGQSARMNNLGTHPLDHSISALGTYYIYSGDDIGWIYFQHDYFVIDPLPSDEEAEIVSLGIGGQLYQNVYRLLPADSLVDHEITEIYFHPEYGLLRVVSSGNQIWDRKL